MRQAIRQPDIAAPLQRAATVDVIAAGKASAVMLNAFASSTETRSRRMLGIGPQFPQLLPQEAEWHTAGHPLPTEGSVTAANRAHSQGVGGLLTDLTEMRRITERNLGGAKETRAGTADLARNAQNLTAVMADLAKRPH